MSRYILKKDGKLYYKETGKPRKETNRRGVMYYDVCVNGKMRALQSDPWKIIKNYNPSEYNIEIDNDVVEDEMFMIHLKLEYDRLIKFYEKDEVKAKKALWVREVMKNEKQYLFK